MSSSSTYLLNRVASVRCPYDMLFNRTQINILNIYIYFQIHVPVYYRYFFSKNELSATHFPLRRTQQSGLGTAPTRELRLVLSSRSCRLIPRGRVAWCWQVMGPRAHWINKGEISLSVYFTCPAYYAKRCRQPRSHVASLRTALYDPCLILQAFKICHFFVISPTSGSCGPEKDDFR